MSYSIIAALIWMVLANIRAMFPSRDNHWRFAYIMMAFGVPILIWVFLENGPYVAAILLVGAMWVMRWPVIYLVRWVRRVSGL
ncbi:hypothetical protein NBRC116601_05140 [Cognatishimia sp. WU-CL00825]